MVGGLREPSQVILSYLLNFLTQMYLVIKHFLSCSVKAWLNFLS